MVSFLILGALLATFVGMLYAGVVGIGTLLLLRRRPPFQALALCFLTLNLCEPLINTYIISHYMLAGYSLRMLAETTSADWLGFTRPMLILLLPLIGIFFPDRAARRVCLALLLLGIVRWWLTFKTATSVVSIFHSADHGDPNMLTYIFLAIGVVWFSAIWGHRTLLHASSWSRQRHASPES